MKGLDTNVLARYIAQDGEEAPAVTRFMEESCTEESPGFLCLVVVCELTWVLRRSYQYDRKAIVVILDKLLAAAEFEVEHSVVAWRALQEYANGTADYADYVIGQICREHDAGPVVTLDKKAGQSPLFTLLDSDKH